MSHTLFRRKTLVVNRSFQYRFIATFVLQASLLLAILGVLVYSHVVATSDLFLNVRGAEPSVRLAMQTELIDNIHGFYGRSLVLIGLTAVVLVVFGLLASHKLAGPVVNLERFLTAYASGDHERRIAFRRKDGLDDFAGHINRVADAIDARRQRRAELAAELFRASERLEDGPSSRGEFLADAERLVGLYREAI